LAYFIQVKEGAQQEASSMMNDTYDQDDNVSHDPTDTNNELDGSDIDDGSDEEAVGNDSGADEVDNYDTDDNADDETSKYLKEIIRRHLRTVMEDFQGPEPPTVQQNDNETVRDFVIQMIIAGLEEDHDTLLAYLVKAAVDVGKTATVEQLETVDYFLRRTVNMIMGVGAKEGTTFLQNILEHLLRKDASEGNELSPRHASESECIAGVTVSVESDINRSGLR
jgi:hypothetical protein